MQLARVRTLRPRFPEREVECWAAAFPDSDESRIESVAARARGRGYLQKSDLVRLAFWKTPRTRPRVARNPEGFVQAVTKTSLATSDERLRIEVLTLLDGVDWPTASVILHFCHPDPYPVLDVRALWSLRVEKPPRYDFELWWSYTLACRRIARRTSCSMRTVDQALWQFSRQRQR